MARRMPTFASIKYQFDIRNPGKNNAAMGMKFGPPPRDGLSTIGDLTNAFDSTQAPYFATPVPAAL
jgi:hypothetical protein